jgi:PAS domain S-box-containing protein
MVTDKRAYNILVIEDNPGDFALVEDFLFEQIEAPLISQADTFKAAKTALTTYENRFDVILLDLTLPDKTGEPLIKDIIELAANTPVIVLTGYSDFDFGVKSLSLGVSNYILKDELTAISLYKSIVYSLERRKSILALEESEKKYSDLFQLSPLPMWVIDLETLQFLDVNKATINHYGYTREEFLSMTLRDIRPPDEIPELERGLSLDRQSANPHVQRMVIHRLKNGDLRQVDIQISRINYKGKKANVVIATDITERLAHIKAIEDQNQKMREISWMQSHVIRAPLARMMGLMDLFMLGCDDINR